MKLAASQIAYQPQDEKKALDILKAQGFCALEIAPTRIEENEPYSKLEKAEDFAKQIKLQYGFYICSMQSIWYGKEGNMFGQEKEQLLQYTKKAIIYAKTVGCKNLVFGCPKNRVLPKGKSQDDALDFFKTLGDFAHLNGTVLALEANPKIYGTNFINTTKQAFGMAQKVASPGFKVNLDLGTMLENGEDAKDLCGHVGQINHVHVSEPMLKTVKKHHLHKELAAVLQKENYKGCVSVEMKAQPLDVLAEVAAYVGEVFL